MPDIWIILLASLGLFVRIGMAIYGCGLSRSKNAATALARHVCDFCVGTIVFWAIGSSILLQHRNAHFALDPALLFGNGASGGPGFLLNLLLVLIPTGIILNATIERARFAVGITLSVFVAGLLVPTLGHSAWFGGLLYQHGYMDLGGAGVAHLSGAVCAAVAAMVVGPRTGKYNRDGSSNAIPGHNLPLMFIGLLMMLGGWAPYLLACNQGFRPSLPLAADMPWFGVVSKTLVAGAAGGLMALWYGRLRYGKVDLLLMSAGLLGGFVAISAGAHVVAPGWALLIGAAAGLLVPIATLQLDLRLKLDDPASVIAIHGVGGLWGLIATGLFASNGRPVGTNISIQLVGAVEIIVLSAAGSLIVLLALKAILGVRNDEAGEFDGLDLAEHDINAYADFQQTMIKSYHLREV